MCAQRHGRHEKRISSWQTRLHSSVMGSLFWKGWRCENQCWCILFSLFHCESMVCYCTSFYKCNFTAMSVCICCRDFMHDWSSKLHSHLAYYLILWNDTNLCHLSCLRELVQILLTLSISRHFMFMKVDLRDLSAFVFMVVASLHCHGLLFQ